MSIIDNKDFMQEIDQLIEIGQKHGQLSRVTVVHLLSNNNLLPEYDTIINYMESKGVQFELDESNIEGVDSENDVMDKPQLFPFDSTKINIAQKPLSVEGIIKRLTHKEIDLKTGFQRKSGLWDNITKSQLIESLMLRIPLPLFYFDGSKDNNWLVIDGLQRLTTFQEFFISKTLKLEGLEYYTDYNGCSYDDLPRTYTRRIEETQLNLIIIQPGTPDNVKFNIFKRINTPGLKLEPQEIRHALYQGPATELLKEIAESQEFRKVTGNSINNERMLGSEIVLRFFAFSLFRINEYEKLDGRQDLFLNNTMMEINKYDKSNITILKEKYYQALERVWNVFGEYSFRRITAIDGGRRNPFNVALYESWMINFSDLSDDEYAKVLDRKDLLKERFIEKLQSVDKTFVYDISSAKKTAVIRRFSTIKKLISEVIYDT